MAATGDGKTFSRAGVSVCSGAVHGCDHLHDRFRVHPVAETFDLQRWQYRNRHSGILPLVLFPESVGRISHGAVSFLSGADAATWIFGDINIVKGNPGGWSAFFISAKSYMIAQK